MSPHQSSHARTPHSSQSLSKTCMSTSWRTSANIKQRSSSCNCHAYSSLTISTASLVGAGGVGLLDYDEMSPLNSESSRVANPLNYYEVKRKECDGGGGEKGGPYSSNNNNNIDMNYFSYPKFNQSYYQQNHEYAPSHNGSWNSSNGQKRPNGSKLPQLNGGGYYGAGGRGHGRPICWSRRKVYRFADYNTA